MSDLVLKGCPVCLEITPLDKVVFFECGHKTCLECYERLAPLTENKPEDRLCAVCRGAIKEPRRIYLSLDEIAIRKPEPGNKVVDGLKKITEDTPAISVMKASSKIRRMQEGNGNDIATARAVVRAKQDLDERIAPLFGRLEAIKEENNNLHARLKELEASNESYRDKATKAKLSFRKEREETERQRQRAELYLSIVKQKEAEITNLQGEKEERDKQIGLMKTKFKVLSKAQKRKSQPSQDADASLQMEQEVLHEHDLKRPSKTLLHDVNGECRVHRVKRRKETLFNDESTTS